MKQPTDWDEKMCGNLQHIFNILRMFEEIISDNELEEPESQNVHGRYFEVPVNYQHGKGPLGH